MSPAERIPRQRRVRPTTAHPSILQEYRRLNGEGPLPVSNPIASPNIQPEVAQLDLSRDDQDTLESAFDTLPFFDDAFEWDTYSITGQDDLMDLDEQSKYKVGSNSVGIKEHMLLSCPCS